MRPVQDRDIPELFDTTSENTTGRDPYVLMHRKNFLGTGIGTCYIAVTEDDHPCYMHWIMRPEDNDAIQSYFKGTFPPLAPDEALLEYGYALPAYRRMGLMVAVLDQTAAILRDMGYRWMILFIDHDNVISLKGGKRAGFEIFLKRTDHWRFFRRTFDFTPVPPGTPFPFEEQT
jgi:GNAT superfamily N-acetyltransferase